MASEEAMFWKRQCDALAKENEALRSQLRAVALSDASLQQLRDKVKADWVRDVWGKKP